MSHVTGVQQEPTTEVFLLCSLTPGRPTADHLIRDASASRFGLDLPAVHVVRLCPTCGSNDHGRPLVAPIQGRPVPWVSISRAGDLTVVALSMAGPVGVDAEPRDAAGFPGFATVALHHAERAASPAEQTVTWVRKESLLKANGSGLQLDPALIRLTDPGAGPPRLLDWPAVGPDTGTVHLYDVDIDPEHVAAVTVMAESRPQLVLSRCAPGAPAEPPREATRRTVR